MAWIDKNGVIFKSVKSAAVYECGKHTRCDSCLLDIDDEKCLALCSPQEEEALEAGTIAALELTPVKEETMNDNVNHPVHYTQGGIECIDAIKASMTPAEYEGYLKGNVLKYLWRWRNKGGVESLCKGKWYLNRLIESQEASREELD